ncbi:MAG: hypothetical protein GVY02_04995 [Bacteroidetes bacterium]|jgi:hypothetical protein|nr:hypothetical protein [Bacteroidota bacterium]
MNNARLFLVTALIVIAAACSQSDALEQPRTWIEGRITVDSTLEESGNFSDIELLSVIRTPDEDRDTLFYAITDSSGSFSGEANFPARDLYPILISRNQNTFGILNAILANEDTVEIYAELPNVNQTAEIVSEEQEVLQIYNRVDRAFNRVARFINAGAFPADSIDGELLKWSDIYWEVFEENMGSYAAKLAGESAVSVLAGVNDSLLINRANAVMQNYDRLLPGTRSLLIEYYTQTDGLDRAVAFLDTLDMKAEQLSEQIALDMERIELLYDSSRVDRAASLLNQFREQYSEYGSAMEWADNISYDLEFLAPGYPFPELRLMLSNGDSLNTSDLNGTPYLIEVTRLDNPLYQQQFDRTLAIHQIYSNFGLQIITIPLGATEVMVDAFFEERPRLWNVVQPNSFDSDTMLELLNINRVPTRFLVNGDGTIIQRYVGAEYDNIVRGLQQITNQNEE